MKKTLLILLAFAMLFSLCACGNDDSKTTSPSDSSQSTTNSTENSPGNTEAPMDGTEGTTGATQTPTDEPTSPPTQAPTDGPTTPPTQEPTETPTTTPTTSPTTCNHSWKDATCVIPKTCNACGATEGTAAGHSWNDATCTSPKTCTKCNDTEGSAVSHSWQDATCTEPKTCTKCNATEGSAVSHSWWDATCTEPKTCSKCGATEGNAAGHSWQDATCTAPKTCTKCNATEGSAVSHSWQDATCTEPKTCSKCNATEGSAVGHSWQDATCTAPKTCTKCNDTEGNAAGHSWKDATCTTPKTCQTCGVTEGSETGHSWGEWEDSSYRRNPCTEDGIEQRTCKNCYAQEEQVVKAAHSYEEGYCTRCEARDANYAFVYIDFKDKLFEAYIKQALGFEPEDKVATVDMKKLTCFTIQSRVSDVEELKYATNLKSITIEASNVSNLGVLSNLPITYVHLGYNGGITEIDVSFMKNLTEVTEVYFYDCKLTGGSMKDVVSSPKLTYYNCLMNYIRDETDGSIDYLSGATNVTTLSLWNDFEYDTDLSVLLNLTKLKSVELYDTNHRGNGYSEQQNAIIDQLIIRGIVVNVKR